MAGRFAETGLRRFPTRQVTTCLGPRLVNGLARSIDGGGGAGEVPVDGSGSQGRIAVRATSMRLTTSPSKPWVVAVNGRECSLASWPTCCSEWVRGSCSNPWISHFFVRVEDFGENRLWPPIFVRTMSRDLEFRLPQGTWPGAVGHLEALKSLVIRRMSPSSAWLPSWRSSWACGLLLGSQIGSAHRGLRCEQTIMKSGDASTIFVVRDSPLHFRRDAPAPLRG